MTGDRTKAILKAGIVPPGTVQEFTRWGSELPEVVPETDQHKVLDGIREAVEGPDTVEVRQTDLDMIENYKANKTRGRLYFADGEKTTFVEVEYARNRIGKYMIPWQDEDISSMIIENTTYLKPTGEGRVYFSDCEELHLGVNKVFLLATPAVGEAE